MPSAEIVLLIIAAGAAAGFVNAVAGGGTFLTFPALVAAGLPLVDANVTSTVALFPAQLASTFAYRREFVGLRGLNLPALSLVSLIGGAAGGVLLLVTPERIFAALVPWLLLFATAVFAWGSFFRRPDSRLRIGGTSAIAVQAVIAVYGGYFGGGIGFLMLAAMVLMGLTNIHAMNGAKVLFAALMNLAAVMVFVFSPAVHWVPALLLALGATAGGWAGPAMARLVPAKAIRIAICVLGVVLGILFLLR